MIQCSLLNGWELTMNALLRIGFFTSFLILSACGSSSEKNARLPLPGTPPPATETQIQELAEAILAMGADIDPVEAARAARVSFEHTHELAVQYQITDRALVHNVKVNLGIKPRGLCKHWAQDMEKRLIAESFETLTIHRAIGAMVGVDHSTVIISRKGEDMYDGIVVDPWRDGGRLTWVHTVEDTEWGWRPRYEVLDEMMFENAKGNGRSALIYRSEGGPRRCLVILGRREYLPSTTDLSQCLPDDALLSSTDLNL